MPILSNLSISIINTAARTYKLFFPIIMLSYVVVVVVVIIVLVVFLYKRVPILPILSISF